MREYRERHLYFFTCKKCGTVNRQSFLRKKAKISLCRKCRKIVINENQFPLFPLDTQELAVVPGIKELGMIHEGGKI